MNATNKKTASGAIRGTGQQLGRARAPTTSRQQVTQVAGIRSKQTTLKKGTTAAPNLQQQLATNLPMINTPTSLTNLAQLSGITLHPIGSTKSKHDSQTQRNKPGNHFSTSLDYEQSNFEPTVQRKKSTKLRHIPVNQDSTIKNQQSASSISSVQSLQFINQATNISIEKNKHWIPISSNSNNIEISSKDLFANQMQSRFSPTPTNPRFSNRGSKYRNHNLNSLSNDIQVIPVPEDLPLYSNVVSRIKPSQYGCSYEDISRSGSNAVEDHCVDVDGDLNNISLMKLMAILNNPALTITAVGNPQDIADSSRSDLPRLEESQPYSKIINSNDTLSFNVSSPPTCHIQPKTNTFNHSDLDEYQVNELETFSKSRKNLHPSNNLASAQRNTTSKRATAPTSTSVFNANNAFYNQEPNQTDPQLDWFSNYTTNSSTNNEESSTFLNWSNGLSETSVGEERDFFLHDKLNDPIMLSTSVRNLMMQQLPADSKRSTVSVQLLKHIANQTKDNDWTLHQTQDKTQNQIQKSILEPECILSVSRNLPELNLGAKYIEKEEVVTSELGSKKKSKHPLHTSKDRLYLPKSQDFSSKKKKTVSEPNFNLKNIDISVASEREVYVSDQYKVLESLSPNSTVVKPKNAMQEPDEIFINRSKRVMSRIDTMLERKKRRRFERISGRSAPKSSSLEAQCAESDDEWSSDENADLEFAEIIKTHLPLKEIETDEKRKHLMSVGLVSRNERNKLLVEHYEERSKIFSPLTVETNIETEPEIQRFVSTMLKTGGIDVQLRTDTSIKRNDLPLIEGLNRNTSRIKMNYMNILGLEKRSKRTTLYKVKQSENSNTASLKAPIDLNKIKSSLYDRQKVESDIPMQITRELPPVNIKVIPPKLNYTSCREAMESPNKNDYMKSLGLMAS